MPKDRRHNTWSRLAWEGWQLEVPADWNPVMLQGTARRGSLVLADLGAPRLELTWLSWSGRASPDLTRSVKKQRAAMGEVVEQPPERWPLTSTFADARVLVSDLPEEVRLVLSSPPSRRVVVARFSPRGLRDREAVLYRVVASLADLSDRLLVPWSIYDFAFALPRGFKLVGHRLEAGGAFLSFARGRTELLRFARVVSVARLREGFGPVELMAKLEQRSRRGYAWQKDETTTHRDHDVTVRRGRRVGWSRVRRRNERCLMTATWYCPACERVFEVMGRGSELDDELVLDSVSHVACHGSERSSP